MKILKCFIVLSLLFGASCSKKNDPDAQGAEQVFTIDNKKYSFKDAAYLDWGYDGDVTGMTFVLVPEKYDRGVDDLEHYPYAIIIDIEQKGKTFKYGTFNVNDWETVYVSVDFIKGDNEWYYLDAGKVSINENGTDNFTITIDGVLDDDSSIRGTYKGAFYKERV